MQCMNCDFQYNVASQYGGAVVMTSDLCHTPNVSVAVSATEYPTFTLEDDSTVLDNNALMGGGLAMMCANLVSDTVEYDGNGFGTMANESSTYRGGAILAHRACLEIEGDTFTSNVAQYGGAIAISAPVAVGCSNNEIEDNTFTDNTGLVDAGAIVVTTAYIDVDEYVVPWHSEWSLTFEVCGG